MRPIVGLCLLAILVSNAADGADEAIPGVPLRYRPVENRHFKVEHLVVRQKSFRRAGQDRQTSVARMDESALVSYGVRPLHQHGTAPIPATIERIEVKGDAESLRYLAVEVLPPERRPDSCGWVHGLSGGMGTPIQWTVFDLVRTFEVLPLVPEKPVSIGDKWTSEIVLGLEKGYAIRIQAVLAHRLADLTKVDGHAHAVIEYSLAGEVDTSKHPEMLAPGILEKIRPCLHVEGSGTAHLDLSTGYVATKEQQIVFVYRWTGRLGEAEVCRNPHWEVDMDEKVTASTKVSRITAEEAQALRAVAAARAAAERPPEPEGPPPPMTTKWEYLLVRTTTEFDRKAQNRRHVTDRSIVRLGTRPERGRPDRHEAAAEVTYVDADLRPAEHRHTPPVQPLPQERLGLLGRLPEGAGETPDFPLPLPAILYGFEVLPLTPQDELQAGRKWTSKLHVGIWGLNDAVPVTVEQQAIDFEERFGRRCLVIKYSLSGTISGRRGDFRGGVTLSGEGTVHYDTNDKIVVTKTQKLSVARVGARQEGAPGTAGEWRTTGRAEDVVSLDLSLRSTAGKP